MKFSGVGGIDPQGTRKDSRPTSHEDVAAVGQSHYRQVAKARQHQLNAISEGAAK